MKQLPLDEFLPTWQTWLDEIWNQVTRLLYGRVIFEGLNEIIAANPDTAKPANFANWCANNYAHHAAVQVRRQIDRDPRSISLLRLMEDVGKNHALITREWAVSHYSSEMREDGYADEQFDQWAGAGGSCVDPAIIKCHTSKLVDVCEKARVFVNKRVAHHDFKAPPTLTEMTFRELNDAINVVEEETCEMIHLLRHAGAILTPTVAYNWKAVFKKPWLSE